MYLHSHHYPEGSHKVAMESELVDKAIQKLNKESSADTLQEDRDTDKLLLSRLLSELESLKSGSKVEKSEASAEQKDPLVGEEELKNEKATRVENSSTQIGAEEIMKELRKVRKQNILTHCLLSAMIVLTLAWQLSEVSLILKVKDGLNHPFKSLGSMIKGMLKAPRSNVQDAETEQHSEASSSSVHLHMPELPHVNLGLNDKDD